jgi:hypothetical protein
MEAPAADAARRQATDDHRRAVHVRPGVLPGPAGLRRVRAVLELEEIRASLASRLTEAREQGWLGEVAAIETTMAAAAEKLEAMRDLSTRRTSIHLGMPDVRPSAGRCSPGS